MVAAAYCGSASRYVLPGDESNGTTLSPNSATAPTLANAANYTCGGAPCQYFTLDSGLSGSCNDVTPRFTNVAIEDQFKSGKLQINGSVHYDDFRYDLGDSNVPAGPVSRRFRRKRVSSGPTATTSGSAATLRRRSSSRLRARTGAPR